jgi:hypothetical protein
MAGKQIPFNSRSPNFLHQGFIMAIGTKNPNESKLDTIFFSRLASGWVVELKMKVSC